MWVPPQRKQVMVPGGGIFLSLKFCSSLSAYSFYLVTTTWAILSIQCCSLSFADQTESLEITARIRFISSSFLHQVRTQHSPSTLSLHFRGCIFPEKGKYKMIVDEIFYKGTLITLFTPSSCCRPDHRILFAIDDILLLPSAYI